MNSTITYPPPRPEPLRDLLDELLRLKAHIVAGTQAEAATLPLAETTRDRAASILNLLNYIVMRRKDLRTLQTRLANTGLSSLGRLEPHVLPHIDRVINILSLAVLHKPYQAMQTGLLEDDECVHDILKQRAENFFGKPRTNRSGYIMVTMPTETAENFELVRELIGTGMDCARINCAHDDETTWLAMIENITKAAKFHRRGCRILMDLAGHKIRTADVRQRRAENKEEGKKSSRVMRNDWIVLSRGGLSPRRYEMLFDAPVKTAFTCTHPDIINQLRRQETVWVDDGKIGAVIRDRRGDAVLLQVTQVGPKGTRIKEEKGLNFPETPLELPTLSKKDLQDLHFVSQHADLVGLSFTERADDVLCLREQLMHHGAHAMPIVAKIETAHAVRRLPDIITRSLARNIDLAIMIARGDLAVELGSVRMAEIQEEILWLCEAGHIPVIWATQVFESLAKQGMASRPEITDAATAVRAECVMLNKGPYIQHAVSVLSDILQRMQAHQFKKISRLRALHW